MKSSALLPSNLPSVIDRSNFSPSREAFCERMTTRNSHGLLQLGREALANASKFYRANNALFVSVDLIGEKNQVILEYILSHGNTYEKKTYLGIFNQRTRTPCPAYMPSLMKMTIIDGGTLVLTRDRYYMHTLACHSSHHPRAYTLPINV